MMCGYWELFGDTIMFDRKKSVNKLVEFLPQICVKCKKGRQKTTQFEKCDLPPDQRVLCTQSGDCEDHYNSDVIFQTCVRCFYRKIKIFLILELYPVEPLYACITFIYYISTGSFSKDFFSQGAVN